MAKSGFSEEEDEKAADLENLWCGGGKVSWSIYPQFLSLSLTREKSSGSLFLACHEKGQKLLGILLSYYF